jgi:hypothetical protein
MKYSLRSLLTFLIRDIALVTAVVALMLGWYADHWEKFAEGVYWRRKASDFAEQLATCTGKPVVVEMRTGERHTMLPTSSAPTTHPPKP